MTARILVPFEGNGAGEASLTWGQRNIWIPVRRHRTSLPIGGICPLPAGVTLGDVAGQLALLAGRHQSLRTRVTFPPDEAAEYERGAAQVLAAEGEIPLEVVEGSTAGGDPAQAAEQIRRRYTGTEFDYPNEWPVRWAVVTGHGVPAYLVSMISHLSVDGFGIMAMLTDLLRRGEDKIGLAVGVEVPDGGPAGMEPTEPLAQARWQASPAGRRVSDRALRHWDKLMRAVPARRFAGGGAPREQRFWRVRMNSPGAHLAAQAIATRLGLSTSPVLFAAYAAAFAAVNGSNPVLAQVLLSNRFRPGLAGTVSVVVQPGLVVIDVAGLTFDAAVTSAWGAIVQASMHSYYDPYAQQDLIAAVGEQRGEPMDVRCFFNDRRMQAAPEAGPALSPGQLEDALARGTLAAEPSDVPDEPFMCSIDDVPGTVAATVNVDTHYLGVDRAEDFLREMEAVLARAAFDPSAKTGA
jgi:hypothetical protein